jgi:hypothetical protein
VLFGLCKYSWNSDLEEGRERRIKMSCKYYKYGECEGGYNFCRYNDEKKCIYYEEEDNYD